MPILKGMRMSMENDSLPGRVFDFMAFIGILLFVLALVWHGAGVAAVASIAALIGVCGRIWIAISRPSGSFRRNKANVDLVKGKWRAKLETESRTDGSEGVDV
jgi:hypothetical protein